MDRAFHETLRLFPPMLITPKLNFAPTVFRNVSASDTNSSEVEDIIVPTGTTVYVHTAGLHYNGMQIFVISFIAN